MENQASKWILRQRRRRRHPPGQGLRDGLLELKHRNSQGGGSFGEEGGTSVRRREEQGGTRILNVALAVGVGRVPGLSLAPSSVEISANPCSVLKSSA